MSSSLSDEPITAVHTSLRSALLNAAFATGIESPLDQAILDAGSVCKGSLDRPADPGTYSRSFGVQDRERRPLLTRDRRHGNSRSHPR